VGPAGLTGRQRPLISLAWELFCCRITNMATNKFFAQIHAQFVAALCTRRQSMISYRARDIYGSQQWAKLHMALLDYPLAPA
jgi:hypothetical protein